MKHMIRFRIAEGWTKPYPPRNRLPVVRSLVMLRLKVQELRVGDEALLRIPGRGRVRTKILEIQYLREKQRPRIVLKG